VDPIPDPLLLRKIWQRRESNPGPLFYLFTVSPSTAVVVRDKRKKLGRVKVLYIDLKTGDSLHKNSANLLVARGSLGRK
jgi:hypothetical protein